MRAAALVVAVASALLLVGCASEPPPAETPVPSTAAPTTPAPTAVPTTEPAAAPTCETLIPAQTVSDFQELGWSPIEEPFRIVATEIEDGLVCKWGGSTGTGEGLQIFGWAPIGDAASEKAQADLIANGWQRIDTGDGTFITEDPATAFATGDQGYGLTFEFGDGWVTYADTKQSLLLIQRPQD